MATRGATKAKNRASVVARAIDELTQQGSDGESSSDDIISDDWINSFERFCEDASSEKMQILWGRVLAGEIKRPGSFGRSALGLLYELDENTAEEFEYLAAYAINGHLWGVDDDKKALYYSIHLDSLGILTGVGGLFSSKFVVNENGHFTILAADTYSSAS